MSCTKNIVNNKSESKGILLAILSLFLSSKYKLKNTHIYINLSKYTNILKNLFPDYNFVKSKLDSTFNIGIHTKELYDINIIYLDQLSYLTNKVKPIPWFDSDNPIVMFKSNKSNFKKDISKIKNKIIDWSNCDRSKIYDGIKTYDQYIEDKIISLYIKTNPKWTKDMLIEYIRKKLSNDLIINKKNKKKIKVPVPYILPVPIQYKQKTNKIQYIDLNGNQTYIPSNKIQYIDLNGNQSYNPLIPTSSSIIPIPKSTSIKPDYKSSKQSTEDLTEVYNKLKQKIDSIKLNSNINDQLSNNLIELEKKVEMVNRSINANKKTFESAPV